MRPSNANPNSLASSAAFDQFVANWEVGTLPKAEWTHSAHVAVGACYAVRYGDSAFKYMKAGLLRYTVAVGIENTDHSGYHETLTRFWIEILMRTVDGIADPLEAARYAVEKFGGSSDLHRQYYSFDVMASIEARRTWVAPDLIPL